MPNENGLGYSQYTYIKQRCLEGLLRMHLSITKSVIKSNTWADRCYYFFDITAGPGRYNGIKGSPLIFLDLVHSLKAGSDALSSMKIPYRAVFIEENPERYAQLLANTRSYLGAKCFHGDHTEIMMSYFLNNFHENKFGILYVDPTGTPPPFGLLAKVSERFPKLDLLISCSASVIKRIRKAPQCKESDTLCDSLSKIQKKSWIVREPVGKYQWTFLLGSNWDNFPAWKNMGFHRVDSGKGKGILGIINLTKEELMLRQQLTIPQFH